MTSRSWQWTLFGWAAALALLAGCKGIPTQAEKTARQNLQRVHAHYRPEAAALNLPKLTPDSPLREWLAYAMLNQPAVQAAYFDWAASVQRVTLQRSLPDPMVTFQMDIASAVTSVMPGLMEAFPDVFPNPAKLRLQAEAASAESDARYFDFAAAVLKAAYSFKQAYYPLWLVGEKIRIDRESLRLLDSIEQSARAQNAVGKGSLQDIYRAQIEQDRLRVDLSNLRDSRRLLLAQFKAALGIRPDQADPPAPRHFELTTPELTADEILEAACARNPRLNALQAEVRRAQASLELARKARVPDFGFGVMADAQAAPTMYRPQFGVMLPIWRDKIAAEIAAAQNVRRAAQARLTAEQIQLTVEFAEQDFDYREVTRDLALLQNNLLPKARESLAIARANYAAGTADFFNLIDAERTLLNFQLEEISDRVRRELVLANLSLLIAGLTPEGAPTAPLSGAQPSGSPKRLVGAGAPSASGDGGRSFSHSPQNPQKPRDVSTPADAL